MARSQGSRPVHRGAKPHGARIRLCALCLLFVGALLLVPSSMAAATETGSATDTERLLDAALEHWITRVARLQEISQRIRLAGRDICGNALTPVLGAAVLDPVELPPPLDDAVRGRLEDHGGLLVVAVFPGMAAERAGLRVGDAILRIGYYAADEENDFYAPYVEKKQDLVLEIARDGERMPLPIEREAGCAYRAHLWLSELVNAFAKWKEDAPNPFDVESESKRSVPLTEFTTALMRQLPNDKAFAAIVGHEIAHAVDSMHNKHGLYSRSVRREERADYIGLYLAAMAGYLPTEGDAQYMLDLVNNIHYVTLRSSHPSTPERIVSFRKTIEEINAKQERGEPIELELR